MVVARNEAVRSVSVGDIIFATVLSCGRTVFRATYAGMSSVEDVIAALRRGINGIVSGPLTVSLRNGTQGWTLHRPMLRRALIPEATQLTLF